MCPRRKLYKSPGLESSSRDLVGSPVGNGWLLILVKQEISEGFPVKEEVILLYCRR